MDANVDTEGSSIALSVLLLYRWAENSFLGAVVQSVVSLTSSLKVISLTVLADSIYNILVYFAEKMQAAFHFFSKKFQQFAYYSM